MKKLIDTLANHQKYLLGVSIFLIFSAVSIKMSSGETKLILGNYPAVILLLVSFSILLLLLYIQIDKRKISQLSDNILELSQEENPTFSESLSDLTSRQKEVYELIITGKSNKEIISELYIEQSTLKSHINQIYKKLNIKNRKELKTKAHTK